MENTTVIKRPLIVMNQKDNVAIALREMQEGENIEIEQSGKHFSLKVQTATPLGHKLAIRDITLGEKIIKYGEIIGISTKNIGVGAHVHNHNMIDDGE